MEFLKKKQHNNFLNKYLKKCKFRANIIYFTFFIEILLFVSLLIFNIFHIKKYDQITSDYFVLADIDYVINNLLTEMRLLALALMDKDEEMIEEHLNYIRNDYLVKLEGSIIPLLKEYDKLPSSNPIVSIGSGKTEFVYLNGYEVVSKFVTYAYNILNTPIEEWMERVDNGENLLYDDIIRTCLVNYPDYADKNLQGTIGQIKEIHNSANSHRREVIYFGATSIVVLTLIIIFYGIKPLLNYYDSFQTKIIKKYKLLMKEKTLIFLT
ncbi:hypothetical protein BCR36DRAFT_57028 [Piromyces finnis]|uniref:Uncharacterized protein n=1 Tax=Piromyces finnis TaxID=1754191 RepID=A0A1Y1U7U4_9FUNG|nr:hypothetical protein BCR36DRAFT_57028 [Piromyces finnis]|eukprot:ORX33614.1 hypothetical protein BCR36DRAFT_57028 [Piromyces finnis]